jgi:hypothetical protein
MFPVKGVLKSNPPSLARSPSELKGFLCYARSVISAAKTSGHAASLRLANFPTAKTGRSRGFRRVFGQQQKALPVN